VPEDDSDRLRQHAEDALARAFDPSRVLPILHRLAKRAEAGSDDEIFAHLRLSELLVDRSPWRASVHARRVLSHRPAEDRAWAVLALAQTLLGHYRFALHAYERAIAACPENPWYAHNLGHLLDVALGNPKAAVPWLERAHSRAPTHVDVAASFAHALARAGNVERARAILAPFRARLEKSGARSAQSGQTGTGGKRELLELFRWLDAGAGESERAARVSPRRPPSRIDAGGADAGVGGAEEPAKKRGGRRELREPRERDPGKRRGRNTSAGLLDVLAQGLRHLPLDTRQRTRARSLARDMMARFGDTTALLERHEGNVASLAAAIAYAIVYVDHVPLSAAEVASPFRVSASRLRGAFELLRVELDLIRGDTRYATQRRM
jgi:hypothetical protein